MKRIIIIGTVIMAFATSCNSTSKEKGNTVSQKAETVTTAFPDVVKVENIAQNPEGIEYNKNDKTFFLSSLNATPIIKVSQDGTHKPFTSGEAYPMSSAGLQIDYDRNRLLATGFNGLELMDQDPATKGMSNLRIYNLETGVIEQDINLSSLAPEANAYFANDIAVDSDGNAYVSDWYARVIYKVDTNGNAIVFWTNETGIPSGPNGLDFHPDGYLLVSILNVNEKGLYADFGLVKIPTNDPTSAKVVAISDAGFAGFDGMVISTEGTVIGVTNDGQMPGGNTLIELSGKNDWESAEVVNTKAIKASTTVAITPEKNNYVINQDFMNSTSETWIIERIEF